MIYPASWALVPFERGLKGPSSQPKYKGWNLRKNCKLPPGHTGAVGIAHAYSSTCAIDFDDLAIATSWLAERGIDANALLEALDAVQISSGRPNRAKLLYRLDTPLRSIKDAPFTDADGKARKALEFRCASANGLTVQDVLPAPGSIHPVTGKPYEWKLGPLADLEQLPLLPEALRLLWESLIAPPAAAAPIEKHEPTTNLTELRTLLFARDASDYDAWINGGMVCHHETGGSDDGLELWDEWSLTAESAYGGRELIESKWLSFGKYTGAPLTMNSLRSPTVSKPSDFEDLGPLPADEAPSASTRFKSVPALQFASGRQPTWLIKAVLPRAELAVIYGESGSGKTFFVLDLVGSIARGIAWRERRTARGRVVYICAEGAGGFKQRIKAYAQQHALTELDIHVIADAPNLLDPPTALALAKRIVLDGGADVIVVDTLSATTPGGNENSGEDVGTALTHCKGLHRATGAVVILIHHSGKDAAKGARGWSGLKAAADAELEVTRFGESRTVSITKLKDGSDSEEFGFKLVPIQIGTDEDGEAVTSCIVEPVAVSSKHVEEQPKGTAQKLVYAAAKGLLSTQLDGEPVDAGEVIRAATERFTHTGPGRNRSSEYATRALDSLVANGFLTVAGGRVSAV